MPTHHRTTHATRLAMPLRSQEDAALASPPETPQRRWGLPGMRPRDWAAAFAALRRAGLSVQELARCVPRAREARQGGHGAREHAARRCRAILIILHSPFMLCGSTAYICVSRGSP